MTGGRGLSQREGILTLRLDYAREQRDAVRSPAGMIANEAPRCLTVLRNDAFADGVQYEFRRIMQVQFLQNVAAMGLDRVETDVELCGDRFVRLPFGQKLQYFALTVGKQLIAIYLTPLFENADVVLSQDSAHFRTKKGLTLRNGLDRAD